MRWPYKGDYRITQVFGVNSQNYKQYGLQGHNGTDAAVPCGTPLYAMISGMVREIADEGNIGYGKYVKIENNLEGALVAHLSSFANIKVNDRVEEGKTLIGKSGTSGNSTGCHTHTGYYLFPRNRQNGYAGYIDPTPHLNKGGDDVNEIDEVRKARDENWRLYQAAKAEADQNRKDRDKHYTDLQAAKKEIENLKKNPVNNEDQVLLSDLKRIIKKLAQ